MVTNKIHLWTFLLVFLVGVFGLLFMLGDNDVFPTGMPLMDKSDRGPRIVKHNLPCWDKEGLIACGTHDNSVYECQGSQWPIIGWFRLFRSAPRWREQEDCTPGVCQDGDCIEGEAPAAIPTEPAKPYGPAEELIVPTTPMPTITAPTPKGPAPIPVPTHPTDEQCNDLCTAEAKKECGDAGVLSSSGKYDPALGKCVCEFRCKDKPDEPRRKEIPVPVEKIPVEIFAGKLPEEKLPPPPSGVMPPRDDEEKGEEEPKPEEPEGIFPEEDVTPVADWKPATPKPALPPEEESPVPPAQIIHGAVDVIKRLEELADKMYTITEEVNGISYNLALLYNDLVLMEKPEHVEPIDEIHEPYHPDPLTRLVDAGLYLDLVETNLTSLLLFEAILIIGLSITFLYVKRKR